MTGIIDGFGTPETVWQDWAVQTRFPALQLERPARIVVVAPHPDDEVLGCGGLASTYSRLGVPISIVAVTDGTASHPGSPTFTPDDLVEVRAAERDRALAELFDTPPHVTRLGLPDSNVVAHEADLRTALAQLLRPDDVCIATWRHDGHTDHEAVGRAAAWACEQTGSRLLEVPIWMWHWATPDHPDVPWSSLHRVDLDSSAVESKRNATACFVSQTLPLSDHPADQAILPPQILARLLRTVETMFV